MQIGGMALTDGVLLVSERHWAAAVRTPDGGVSVHSGRRVLLPGRDRLAHVPLARGVVKLAESMAVLPRVRRAIGVPVLPQEDPRMMAAAVAGSAAAVVLRQTRRGSPAVKEMLVALLTLGPALLALRDSKLSGYHGAEHKSIAAQETGGPTATAPKEHTRCGGTLLAPLVATNVAANAALRKAGAERSPLAVLAAGLVSIGGAMELFSWMAKHEGHPLAELLKAPGLELQRLVTTSEPTSDQLDVAEHAMRELLRREGGQTQA